MSDRRMRILIVGINYAPEHSGIGPYTTEAAEHWASRGHEVRVITGVDHYPHWTVPPVMLRRTSLRERRNNVDVRRLRHYVPRQQSALRRAIYEATFGTAVALAAAAPADVVVGVTPSLAGAAAAARAARRMRSPFVLWMQDVMGQAAEQSGINGGAAIAQATHRLERWTARQADVVAVVSEAFRSHVAGFGIDGSRISRLPNWSHMAASTEARETTRRRLGWDDGRIVALHSGNMGLKQGLENVIAAARLADVDRGRPVRFVLMGDGNQRKQLEALASTAASAEVRAPVASDEFTNVLQAADVLVVNERPGVRDMSLPSKLTSYFAAGRPVVAATHEGTGTALEIGKAAAGSVVPPGDPAALVDAIREWAADDARAVSAGAAAREYAREVLSPEVARANLDELLLLATTVIPRAAVPVP
jgi:glycosyltransferase involved in cell wall biosynthesis